MSFRLPARRRWPAVLVFLALVGGPGNAEPNPPVDKAFVRVRLPANAILVIGSSPTEQTGPERLFVSPELEPGTKYTYSLTAAWMQDGKERKEVREIEVRAGVVSTVDFKEPQQSLVPIGATDSRRSRTFQFTYAATVTGLKPDAAARVWLPVPPTTDEQEVKMVSRPKDTQLNTAKKYGNAMLYLEAKADADGKIPLEVVFLVKRKEVTGQTPDAASPALLADFLLPDAKVPIAGKPLELIKDKQLPADQTETARVLYDVVNAHMRYSKEGQGWGRGDSVWACENGYGNCTDFHSLFISLVRAQKIPAKFEIGFPIPEKQGAGDVAGYHCWAKFRPTGKGWIAVDISEANKNPKLTDYYFGNLTADRVAFTTGRDLELVPRQDGEPLNFFIYPYVEVGGKVYPPEKIERKFSYQDK